MLKKISAALFLFVCLARTAQADSLTTRLSLTKPTIGSTGWAQKTNANWEIVDSSAAAQTKTNVFTATNTFSVGPVLIATTVSTGSPLVVNGFIESVLNGFKFPDGSVQASAASGGGSGATGQVTYWASSTTIAGTNSLYWSTSTSRLGIGTTSPDVDLSIVNTGSGGPAFTLSRNSTNYLLLNTILSANSGFTGTVLGDSVIAVAGLSQKLHLGARLGSTAGMTISSSSINTSLPLSVTGAVSATSFSGSGASLTALNASELTSGTLLNARLDSSSVTLQANVFNGASQLVQLDSSTRLPAVSGALVTSLSASALASGTVPNARLDPSSVTLQGNTFNGASQLVQLTAGGILPALSGANLTNLDASDLASGTVPNARLDPSSVTLQGNAFNGASQLVQLDGSSALPAVSGANLTSLSAGNIASGTLPIARGGTNSGTALSGSSIMISNGSAVIQGAAGTSSTLLHGNAAGAPTYGALDLASETTGLLSGSNVSGGTFGAVNGSALTNLNASNLASGSVADARLSANVPLLNGTNAFTGTSNSWTGSALDTVFLTEAATALSGDNPQARTMFGKGATTSGSAVNISTFTLADNTAYQFAVRVVGRRTGGGSGTAGDSAVYLLFGGAKRTSAGVAVAIGAGVSQTSILEDQSAWNATLVLSGNVVAVQSTGAANNNVSWTAYWVILPLGS